MNEDKIEEYYKILDMYETALCGLKWVQNEHKGHYKALITQFETIHKYLMVFGINNIGILD